MPTAIAIDRVSKRYPGAPSAAVDAVSLSIAPGDLFFLLGPSGCGKTTLLRMIAGFIEPTGGAIRFGLADGREVDVSGVPPNKRNTGMVFQSYALWPHMTVAENVGFGLDVRKVTGGERQRRIAEALEMVQMGQYAARKPNALSGGQQQRVALARALVIRPDVLLLDEPLSNLDAKLRVELRGEIRRICKQAGITTVYVTHDQKEALSMADRVAIMTMGKVEQLGTPGELYRRPRSRFVAEFLGETNFLEGTVRGWTPEGAVEVATAAGVLRAANTGGAGGVGGPGQSAREGGVGGGVGQPVWLSLRPEALHAARAGEPNTLRGTVVESTYLGDTSQEIIELAPAEGGGAGGGAGVGGGGNAPRPRLKRAVLNPLPAHGSAPAEVTLGVAPEDVVLVPR